MSRLLHAQLGRADHLVLVVPGELIRRLHLLLRLLVVDLRVRGGVDGRRFRINHKLRFLDQTAA